MEQTITNTANNFPSHTWSKIAENDPKLADRETFFTQRIIKVEHMELWVLPTFIPHSLVVRRQSMFCRAAGYTHPVACGLNPGQSAALWRRGGGRHG
eukprot:6453235-Ditylum_brightwellii.AAC.2